MMTAMASTEPVIGVESELLPCIISISCMVFVGMQIMWVVHITVFKTTLDVSLVESVRRRSSVHALVN